MTDTPFTIETMKLAADMAAAVDYSDLEIRSRALLQHLRAAQAVPEDERAAFEAMCVKRRLEADDYMRFNLAGPGWATTYRNSVIEGAWIGWQAARGAKT